MAQDDGGSNDDCVICHQSAAPVPDEGEIERIAQRVDVAHMHAAGGTQAMPCECKQRVHSLCLYRWLAHGANNIAVSCPLCARTLAHDVVASSRFADVDAAARTFYTVTPSKRLFQDGKGLRGLLLSMNELLGTIVWEPVIVCVLLSHALAGYELSQAAWWAAASGGFVCALPLLWLYNSVIAAHVCALSTAMTYLLVNWFMSIRAVYADNETYGASLQRKEIIEEFLTGGGVYLVYATSGHARSGGAAFVAWACTHHGVSAVVCTAVTLAAYFAAPLLLLLTVPGGALSSLVVELARNAARRIKLTGWEQQQQQAAAAAVEQPAVAVEVAAARPVRRRQQRSRTPSRRRGAEARCV